jgi:C-lobe and N-lobe beta barrels of Tf-binding protein B
MGASAGGSDFINLDTLGAISSAAADQPHIRYTANGTYEIELPGAPVNGFTWHPLSLYGQGTGQTVLTDDTGDLLLVLSGSKDEGYRYSELASWRWGGLPDMIGAFAFGTLTPDGAVPVTGSATYSGIVAGKSDVIASDSFDGPNRAGVTGSVSLDFDFGTGSLGGAMTLNLTDNSGASLPVGTFNFKDTVFSVGSTSYSGKFNATAAGDNFFLGKFTGPNAEETIGAWALPFTLDSGNATISADHQAHQAFGAWIAKKP